MRLSAVGVWLLVALTIVTAEPVAAAQRAVVLRVQGVIGPATAAYVSVGLRAAAQRAAPVVVLRIDTPGGLDTSMRDIVRDILDSSIPVIAYVNPSGARAASAGTYILYASHLAAMTPGTNVGAATPIKIGGALPDQSPKQKDEQAETPAKGKRGASSNHAPENTLEAKMVNDAAAYIRSLAELRGRNADWAEKAVREAASLSAREALEQKVVDVVAPNLEELLAQAHGRIVLVRNTKMTLDTKDLSTEEVDPDWRTQLLGVITNPNVALILLMLGIYGLIIEFWSPGVMYPGIIGTICLLLGLYALAELPVNYAGLSFLLLGMALIVAEAFFPSFGSLGFGGAISFVIGATILIDTKDPNFQVSRSVIAASVAAVTTFTIFAVRSVITSYRRKVVTGCDALIGSEAEVEDWTERAGHIRLHGERWNAVSSDCLSPKQRVRVVKLDGLTAMVEPL